MKNNTTRIYIVRHGESISNRQGIFTGSTDIDLTDMGYRQAELVGEYLADKGIEAIYSSDLMRAYHTSLPTSRKLGIESVKDEGFREVNGGEWENKRYAELFELYPKELIFLSVEQTIEMINILSPTGGLYENEKRVALGLKPLPELEGLRYMSLNWVNADMAEQYQLGKVNVDIVDEEKEEV